MKKILTLLSIATLFIFASCSDPVFQTIRAEVPLEQGQITGFISSIVRFTEDDVEKIYLQNGRMYSKNADDASYGAWQLEQSSHFSQLSYDYFAQRFNGLSIVKLASDSQTLYALTAKLSNPKEDGIIEVENFYLYAKSKNASGKYEWQKITDTNLQTALSTQANEYKDLQNKNYAMEDITKTINLLCTNTPKKENRKAFLKIADKFYSLENGVATLQDLSAKNAKSTSVNVAYYNSDVHFFDTTAVITNETSTTQESKVYFANGTKLYYFDSNTTPDFSDLSTITSIEMSTDKTIATLALSKNSILVGTNENGIFRATLNTTGVPSKTETFISNTNDVLCSPYIVSTLLSTYPEKNEEDNLLYASLVFKWTESNAGAQYTSTGLWSYYPSRKNWNRE